MSAAASNLDKRGGDIESYLENFCRCSTLHNKIGFNSVPRQQLTEEIHKIPLVTDSESDFIELIRK